MVWYQAAPTKAAGTAELVHPLGPLRVQMTVWLLILRLKDTYDVLRCENGRNKEDVERRGGDRERERERETLIVLRYSRCMYTGRNLTEN